MSTAIAHPLTPDAESFTDLERSTFSMTYRKAQYPVTILMPYLGGIRGPVVASLLYYAKHLDVGFELVGNTLLSNARNELASRFLRSKTEWSLWLDSDVFIPYGDAGTFLTYSRATKGQNFAQHNTITRLLSHKYPLVGGCYAGRCKGTPLTIQPDLAPRNPNDTRIAQSLREGKAAGGLQPVEWVAAGLMLVHRTVFESIMKHFPWTPPFPTAFYPFFEQQGNKGEDVVFCDRARAAGIKPVLDTEIRAGHIGEGIWMPEDSQPPIKLQGRRAQEVA
jgi:hypothetical protein